MTDAAAYEGVWVVLPTYNEAENLAPISAAIREALPGATLLVVDDGSPDGTGQIADELAAADDHVRVRHRAANRVSVGRTSTASAWRSRAERRSSCRWTPTGPTTRRRCHRSWRRRARTAPTSSSARDTPAAVGSWTGAWARRAVSRGGSLFARTVLGLLSADLTGGFKAWRPRPWGIPFEGIHAGGYVFQIEMTYRASRAGARVMEVPITFRDRRVGQSKMSRRIVAEALRGGRAIARRGTPRAVQEAAPLSRGPDEGPAIRLGDAARDAVRDAARGARRPRPAPPSRNRIAAPSRPPTSRSFCARSRPSRCRVNRPRHPADRPVRPVGDDRGAGRPRCRRPPLAAADEAPAIRRAHDRAEQYETEPVQVHKTGERRSRVPTHPVRAEPGVGPCL